MHSIRPNVPGMNFSIGLSSCQAASSSLVASGGCGPSRTYRAIPITIPAKISSPMTNVTIDGYRTISNPSRQQWHGGESGISGPQGRPVSGGPRSFPSENYPSSHFFCSWRHVHRCGVRCWSTTGRGGDLRVVTVQVRSVDCGTRAIILSFGYMFSK